MPWLPLLCFSDVSWEGVGGNSPHEILREEIEQLFIFFFFFFLPFPYFIVSSILSIHIHTLWSLRKGLLL